MEKVAIYIDAYNIYHALKECGWRKYYWLDLPKLCKNIIKENQQLEAIYYFTSSAINQDSRKRQITYIEALEHVAITQLIKFQVIRGRFVTESVRCDDCIDFAACSQCQKPLEFTHEKETDVNISVQMLSDAYEDVYDVALLLSEDSDQVGTIKTIKKLFFDQKKIGVLFPPRRSSEHLKSVSDFYLHISESDLNKCQLPLEISKTGGYILRCPQYWKVS